MRHALRLVAAFAVLACAAPAAADPPWSQPAPIDDANAFPPTVTFNAKGEGLGVWPDVGHCGCKDTFAAVPRADGSFGPRFRLITGIQALQENVAIDPGRRVVVVGYGTSKRDADLGERALAAAAGTIGSKLRRLRPFLPRGVASFATGRNSRGDIAVVAYMSRKATQRASRRAVYFTVRRAGGSFTKPRVVARIKSRGHGPALAVPMNDAGQALVTWTTGGRVYARPATRRGRLGSTRALGAGGAPQGFDADEPFLTAALGADGQAVVAWESAETPRARASDNLLTVAVRPSASAAFGPATVVDRDPRLGSVLDSAALDRGRILVTWGSGAAYLSDPAPPPPPPRAVVVRGAQPGPAQPIPGTPFALSSSPRGDAVILWPEQRPGTNVPGGEYWDIYAAVMPAGADAFGPREHVSDPVPSPDLAVAINPVTRRPLATWSNFVPRSTSSQFQASSSLREPIG